MKQWFNWQLKNQVVDPKWPTKQRPVANIANSLGWFKEYIEQGFTNNTLEYYYDNVFYRDDWVKKASSSTDGAVDAETLRSWMHDPELSTLMDNQGVEYIVNFPPDVEKRLKSILAERLSLIEDTINVRVHVQRPGQFFALHFDRNKYGQFDPNNPVDTYETKSEIYLVFLNKQELGQVFQIGRAQVSWDEGDVFTWQQVNMPHGSANFGFENRYAILLTGFAKKEILSFFRYFG
jgi:hypothetical protein